MLWRPSFRACAAGAHGGGTFKITGGTGAYRHAKGAGHFADSGVQLGARTPNGACLVNAPPRLIYVIAALTGRASR
jgi:hypothetical protein